MAVADAGGIAPLVAVLGLGSERAQEQAAGALASLALDNAKNELSIAKLIVSFLETDEKLASAKAARAISRLARANGSNQRSIAAAGGVSLLVKLLDVEEGGVGSQASGLAGAAAVAALESAKVQKEMASAIWAMAQDNPDNQVAIASAGGIPPLIALLEGHPEVHRDVAGALWSLAANADNQVAIADAGRHRAAGGAPQERLARRAGDGGGRAVRARRDGREPRLDRRRGRHPAAGGALRRRLARGDRAGGGRAAATLVRRTAEPAAIANEAVAMLRNGSADRAGARDRAAAQPGAGPREPLGYRQGGRGARARAAARDGQREGHGHGGHGPGAHRAQIGRAPRDRHAASWSSCSAPTRRRCASARARRSPTWRPRRPHELQEAGGVLRTGGGGCLLVNLLKDGLKDGRVEAQEYALRSLLSMSDAASKEAIVEAGCILPLIAALTSGRLSATAQEHAATVLSGLAPLDNNAQSIKEAKGIDPLVTLLSTGNADAKEHAAAALAQLALRAEAALEIAKAGAVSAFVKWLVDPSLGPPEVAARALSEIALDNPDTQAQIAEEGAISPLVQMVGAGSSAVVEPQPGQGSMVAAVKAIAAALKVSNVAAGALATLAKDNIVNQIMITEEGGIPPLVDLLKDDPGPHRSHENADQGAVAPRRHRGQPDRHRQGGRHRAARRAALDRLGGDGSSTRRPRSQALARDHTDNQIALAKAGAIEPARRSARLRRQETQEHAVAALLFLARTRRSRNAVVKRLVAVLDARNGGGADEGRRGAGGARRALVRQPQGHHRRKRHRAAGAAAGRRPPRARRRRRRSAPPPCSPTSLAWARTRSRSSRAGGVKPLVMMLSSDSPEAQTHAAGCPAGTRGGGLEQEVPSPTRARSRRWWPC